MKRNFIFVVTALVYISYFVQINGASTGGKKDVTSAVVKPQPFSPQVVFKCNYRNRYLSKDGNGEWVTDKDPRASCLTGKLDILKYCRKVYPDLEITNIVESSHYYAISSWCTLDGRSCKGSFWVKPYRCIVGTFESEALLVPEGCHFGHVDEQTLCKDFDYWNRTAHAECGDRPSTPTVRSFAMLEPCGLDMFSGVEYVCCKRSEPTKRDPTQPRIEMSVKVKLEDNKQLVEDEDDDDYSEEDDDDAGVQDEKAISAPATTAKVPSTIRPRVVTSSKGRKTSTVMTTSTDTDSTEDDEDEDDDSSSSETASSADDQDSYFKIADPDREHSEYLAAMDRLEKRHRVKVAKVMKEWSELETRYQEMKVNDPHRAEQFKRDMTSRFQRTVSALEEENRNERSQIDQVHQQRVNAALNERKRESMKSFQEALWASHPQPHKVLRALQAFVRAEEKDRIHSLNRYRHLLRTDADAAAAMKKILVKKMKDIDLRINGTIEMLRDVPSVQSKVKPAIVEFWQNFRDEHETKFVDDALTTTTGRADKDNSHQIQREFSSKTLQRDDNEALLFEQSQMETKGTRLRSDESSPSNEETVQEVVKPVIVGKKENADNSQADKAFTTHEDVKQAHLLAMKETIQHQAVQAKEEISPELHQQNNDRYAYAVFGVAGATLILAMIGAACFITRRFSAQGQGFVEVDSCLPEERDVSAMQISGYENPTYKYLDKP